MKKLLLAFLLPFYCMAQVAPEFIHLKPVYTQTVVFDYVDGNQTWTVPTDVTRVFIDVLGAQGGNFAGGGSGGLGGKVRAVIPVTPGETLYLMVGGQPVSNTAVYGNGGNGGINTASAGKTSMAGGGMSAVYKTSIAMANALLVAGGGGGAASFKNGGFGGGLTGGNPDLRCGYGGSQLAGGATGQILDTQFVNPTAGQTGQGGKGGHSNVSSHNAGGGGGAGFFGGGGGVAGGAGFGSGGGGSSWASPSLAKIENIPGFNSGNGKIIIYYNL